MIPIFCIHKNIFQRLKVIYEIVKIYCILIFKVEEKEIGSAPMSNVETITFHGEITATDVMPLDQEVEAEEMMMVSVGDGVE